MPKKAKDIQERDAKASQQKILVAAEVVFAEKGFDGARVDEIAKIAQINKAMIYYYFQSKEQLLRALIDKHFNEMAEEKKSLIDSFSEGVPIPSEKISDHMMEMFAKRSSFLRIITIEALKNNDFTTDLFQIIDYAVPHLNSLTEKAGMSPEEVTRLKTNIFYFGFAPILMYFTVGGQWTEYSDMDQKTFRQSFINDYQNSYIRSIKEMLIPDEPK
ncbi:TetR/AcrR family transcriptional regulator [Saccharibacillus endophyticus]|uniref:TetR family transcriptional regulator n=1 Tax=Saccharibacillus endophyticus TaxID=2060666 RepID=A0ABQ1ZW19_9BACL|nr:TetR/AcrR family transcriptional regulator [Saccharibacillus endophyticus]GGH80789.1 TetR family transcriptional regulator [Saccharibacillus endophyticus]